MEAQPDAPQEEPPPVECSLKPLEEFLPPELVLLAAVSPGAQAARPLAPTPSEAQPRAPERPEPPVAQPPSLPEASPLALPPVAQPLLVPEHA